MSAYGWTHLIIIGICNILIRQVENVRHFDIHPMFPAILEGLVKFPISVGQHIPAPIRIPSGFSCCYTSEFRWLLLKCMMCVSDRGETVGSLGTNDKKIRKCILSEIIKGNAPSAFFTLKQLWFNRSSLRTDSTKSLRPSFWISLTLKLIPWDSSLAENKIKSDYPVISFVIVNRGDYGGTINYGFVTGFEYLFVLDCTLYFFFFFAFMATYKHA